MAAGSENRRQSSGRPLPPEIISRGQSANSKERDIHRRGAEHLARHSRNQMRNGDLTTKVTKSTKKVFFETLYPNFVAFVCFVVRWYSPADSRHYNRENCATLPLVRVLSRSYGRGFLRDAC